MEQAKILLKINQVESYTRLEQNINHWLKLEKEISYGKYEVVGEGPKPKV